VRREASELEALYRAHGHLVLRRARSLLGSEPDANEALQEVFAALSVPSTLAGVRSVVGWLYRATTHYCLKRLRDRRATTRALSLHSGEGHPTSARGEAAAELRSLLAQLPDEEAAALVYHHLDGMTQAEVAELLGCSRRKVGYLLERAEVALRREEWTA
jgi:RNA polymerase sigma-70 factor, ECF subfamily